MAKSHPPILRIVMPISAKDRFYQLMGRTPSIDRVEWPFLHRRVREKMMDEIHYYLAQHLLKDYSESSEAIAAALSFTSMAIQQGHGCVYVDGGHLFPPLSTVIPESLCPSEEIHQWERLIFEGIASIHPKAEAFHCIEEEGKKLLCFHSQWQQEMECWNRWKFLSSTPPSIQIDQEKIRTLLQTAVETKKLLIEQTQAIEAACQQSIILLLGGPGTGKSYTAGWIIKIILESLADEKKESFRILLAAPTGKAAANLSLYIQKAVDPKFTVIAKTLHSLLEIGKKKRMSTLAADLILVDECSMVDNRQMFTLLKAIKPGTRLVLIGDKAQLPPVEAGAFFSDLTELSHHSIELKTCLRTDSQAIVQFAHAIATGNKVAALDLLDREDKSLEWISPPKEIKGIHSLLFQKIKERGPFFYQSGENIEAIFRAFNRFRLLSPMRQGLLGVNTLNELIFHHIYPKASETKKIIPILVSTNDYRLQLFNGEIGIVMKQNQEIESHPLHFKKGDVALFISSEGKIKEIPALLLPEVELAYCLSVHKSQGSEFDEILLVLPDEAASFGRELLYTGVTRGKKKVEIIGSRNVLQNLIIHSSRRCSILKFFDYNSKLFE